ncbi:MAG: cation:proton antiporter [Acidimicrobiales bacterium]
MDDPFQLTAVILATAALVGFVGTRLRQPLIVAFIAVGVALGPSVLDLVADAEPLELFAEIGIAVLLFLVGLKLDLQLVRSMGTVALATGLGQVGFTSGVGFLLALLLGMDAATALYVAIALTFSSTIIIVKLLSDKRELDDLHGKVAIGFLIVQDIVVVLVMIALSAFSGDTGQPLVVELGLMVVRGAAFLGAVAVIMRWVLPAILHQIANSSELLLVFAVAWAVAVAAVSDVLGFSTEVGAFLAGFALASTPFREAIGTRLTPLRDFLLLFFFIELGSQMDLGLIGDQVPSAIALSLFVLVGNPIIVLVIMGALGYPRRVGFLAGLTVAQISEFSLILAALGLELGHIESDAVGLVTLVGLITIGLSTYLILYSGPIYDRIAPLLTIFERRSTKVEEPDHGEQFDTIVYGYGRFGRNVVHHLVERGHRVLVVDWNPYADDDREGPVEFRYGDAEDSEFPGTLPLADVGWVISTVPRADSNRALMAALRHWSYRGRTAVTAHDEADAALLETCGATLVFEPFTAAAEMAALAVGDR